MNSKPKVGDKLYLVNQGVNVRYKPCPPEYVTVTKVGRKYFSVSRIRDSNSNFNFDLVFHIDNWAEKTDYVSNWSLYKSEQDYIDHTEVLKWRNVYTHSNVRFQIRKCTLQQLRSAGEILGLTIEEE